MGHEFGELPLVFGRMKATIERDVFDTIVETLLLLSQKGVRDRFSIQRTTASRAANLLCALDKDCNFRDLSDRREVEFIVVTQCFARFGGTREYRFGAPQKLAILVRKSLLILGSLASADASILTSGLLDFLEQVFMLPPSDDVVDIGKLNAKFDRLAHAIDDQ